MKLSDLMDEYSDKAATRASDRQTQRRRIENQRKAIEATPIDDDQALADQVAQLAAAWGLKKRPR
jgi:hypothetical protein